MCGIKREIAIWDEGDGGEVFEVVESGPVASAGVHLACGAGVDGDKAQGVAIDEWEERSKFVWTFDAEAGFDGEVVGSHFCAGDVEEGAEDVGGAEESGAATFIAYHWERATAIEVGGGEACVFDADEAVAEGCGVLADELRCEADGFLRRAAEFAIFERVEAGVGGDEGSEGFGEMCRGEEGCGGEAEGVDGDAAEWGEDEGGHVRGSRSGRVRGCARQIFVRR